MNGALGRHVLLELYDCDLSCLRHPEQVRKIMLEAARRGNATVVRDVFHQFSPYGVSGVVVIAESHLTIHTWPEHGYAAVDLFTCSRTINSDEIEAYLRLAFGAKRLDKFEFERGRADAMGSVKEKQLPSPQ